MKKLFKCYFMLLFGISILFPLISCNETNSTTKTSIELISVHTHNWTLVKDTATCTEGGVKTYSCSCGERKTENSKANGHKYANAYDIKCVICGSISGLYKKVTISGDESSKTISQDVELANFDKGIFDAYGTCRFTINNEEDSMEFTLWWYSYGRYMFYVILYNSDGHRIGRGEIISTSKIQSYKKSVDLQEKIKKDEIYYYLISCTKNY